jgi:hypothetical protein
MNNRKSVVSKNNSTLMKLILSIVSGDSDEALKIVKAFPNVVYFSLATGASSDAALGYYYKNIGHYLVAGDTPLHAAAAAYRIPLVKALIRNNADVEAKNRRGAEPLHYASDGQPDALNWNPKAQVQTIRALLEAGAKPNTINQNGVGPLHRAVRQRCAAAVNILLLSGADVNMKNGNGSTPLHLAVQDTGRGGSGMPDARKLQREVIVLLVNAGANLDAINASGKTVRESIKSKWIRDFIASYG